MDEKNRLPLRTILIIMLLAAAVRVAVYLLTDNQSGDPDSRCLMAVQWALHPRFQTSGYWLPFHFYSIGALYYLVGDPIVAGKLLSLITGTLTFIPYCLLAARLFGNQAGIVAGVLLAIFGVHINASCVSFAEAPYSLLAMLGMWIALPELEREQPRPGRLYGAAAALAVAGGFRQEAWTITGVIGLMMLLNKQTRKHAPGFLLLGGSTGIAWAIGNYAAGCGFDYCLRTQRFRAMGGPSTEGFSVKDIVLGWQLTLVRAPNPVILLLGLTGIVTALRKRIAITPLVLMVVLVVPVMIMTIRNCNLVPVPRYMIIYHMLFLMYVAYAIVQVFGKWRMAAAATGVVVLLTLGWQYHVYRNWSTSRLPVMERRAEEIEIWPQVRKHLRPDDRLLVEDHGLESLGIVLKTGAYKLEYGIIEAGATPEEVEAIVKRVRPTLLVLHSKPEAWPQLPKSLQPLVSTSAYTIYRAASPT